jgi:hypothetical protein
MAVKLLPIEKHAAQLQKEFRRRGFMAVSGKAVRARTGNGEREICIHGLNNDSGEHIKYAEVLVQQDNSPSSLQMAKDPIDLLKLEKNGYTKSIIDDVFIFDEQPDAVSFVIMQLVDGLEHVEFKNQKSLLTNAFDVNSSMELVGDGTKCHTVESCVTCNDEYRAMLRLVRAGWIRASDTLLHVGAVRAEVTKKLTHSLDKHMTDLIGGIMAPQKLPKKAGK